MWWAPCKKMWGASQRWWSQFFWRRRHYQRWTKSHSTANNIHWTCPNREEGWRIWKCLCPQASCFKKVIFHQTHRVYTKYVKKGWGGFFYALPLTFDCFCHPSFQWQRICKVFIGLSECIFIWKSLVPRKLFSCDSQPPYHHLCQGARSGQCVWEALVWLRRRAVPLFLFRLAAAYFIGTPRPDFQNLFRKHCVPRHITELRCQNCWLKSW